MHAIWKVSLKIFASFNPIQPIPSFFISRAEGAKNLAFSIDLDRLINSEFIRENQVKSAKFNALKAQKKYHYFCKINGKWRFLCCRFAAEISEIYKLLRFFTQNFHDFEKKDKIPKKLRKFRKIWKNSAASCPFLWPNLMHKKHRSMPMEKVCHILVVLWVGQYLTPTYFFNSALRMIRLKFRFKM